MHKHTNRSGEIYYPRGFDKVLFIENNHSRNFAIVGSHGSGKTALGTIKVIEKIYNGYSGAMIAHSFQNLKIHLFPELRKWLNPKNLGKQRHALTDPNWFPSSSITLNFKNESKLHGMHESDFSGIRGLPPLNFAFMDEPLRDSTIREVRTKLLVKYVGLKERIPQFWVTCKNKDSLYFMDLENEDFEMIHFD